MKAGTARNGSLLLLQHEKSLTRLHHTLLPLLHLGYHIARKHWKKSSAIPSMDSAREKPSWLAVKDWKARITAPRKAVCLQQMSSAKELATGSSWLFRRLFSREKWMCVQYNVNCARRRKAAEMFPLSSFVSNIPSVVAERATGFGLPDIYISYWIYWCYLQSFQRCQIWVCSCYFCSSIRIFDRAGLPSESYLLFVYCARSCQKSSKCRNSEILAQELRTKSSLLWQFWFAGFVVGFWLWLFLYQATTYQHQ